MLPYEFEGHCFVTAIYRRKRTQLEYWTRSLRINRLRVMNTPRLNKRPLLPSRKKSSFKKKVYAAVDPDPDADTVDATTRKALTKVSSLHKLWRCRRRLKSPNTSA
jgi:hypothetical protein